MLNIETYDKPINSIAQYAFNKVWLEEQNLNPENLKIFKVNGEGMSPIINDGDKALIDTSQIVIKGRNIMAFKLRGDFRIQWIAELDNGDLSIYTEFINVKGFNEVIKKSDIKETITIIGKFIPTGMA